jgi:ketosteroid isomerase-like protein
MSAMLKFGLFFAVVMLLGGCKSTAVSDETLIANLFADYQQKLQAQDIDAVVAMYSDSFAGDQGMTKENLREFMNGAKAQGMLQGVTVSAEGAQVTINADGTATMAPVRIYSSNFDIAQTYTLKKEAGGWMIVGTAQR